MGATTIQTKRDRGRSKRLVARHGVRERLKQMILEGQHKPGSKLIQQDLAKKFHVSQAVVREALLELQVCGLAEAIDNRGVFVSKLDTPKLLESYDVREVHEGLAARVCVERMTRAQIRALKDTADRIYALGQAGKLQQMASLDRELHRQLLQHSGNSMLMRLAENYWVLGKVIRVGRNSQTVRKEHLAILQAIEDNRPAEAEKLMRAHIRAGRKAVEKQIRSGKFVPKWVR